MRKEKPARALPRIRLNVTEIMKRADGERDLVTFPSEIKGIGYITDEIDALIITTNGGYLRIDAKHLATLTSELIWISEEIERRSRD